MKFAPMKWNSSFGRTRIKLKEALGIPASGQLNTGIVDIAGTFFFGNFYMSRVGYLVTVIVSCDRFNKEKGS